MNENNGDIADESKKNVKFNTKLAKERHSFSLCDEPTPGTYELNKQYSEEEEIGNYFKNKPPSASFDSSLQSREGYHPGKFRLDNLGDISEIGRTHSQEKEEDMDEVPSHRMFLKDECFNNSLSSNSLNKEIIISEAVRISRNKLVKTGEREKRRTQINLENNEEAEYEYEESAIREKFLTTFSERPVTPSFQIDKPDNVDEKWAELAQFVDMDPVEKVDKYYKDKYQGTKMGCCVLVSFCILRFRKSISSTCSKIIKHNAFEAISLIVIIMNSIILALEDPTVDEDEQPTFFKITDYVFLGLYSLEMILKILGMGFFFEKEAYIKDPWNVLDFVIVLSGYFEIMFGGVFFDAKSLRTFRVLRPLRTISGIEGLRILVSALIGSLPMLGNTIIILLFFFIIFAIGGLQLWMGILKFRCINIATGLPEGDGNELCGESGRKCPDGYECAKYYTNPYYGVVNFDDIFSSLLVIFQCVTLEGWTTVMIIVQKAFSMFVFFFFIPLIFIGAFFLLNLTLVVIKFHFSEEQQTVKDKKAKKAGKDDDDEPDNNAFIKMIQRAKGKKKFVEHKLKKKLQNIRDKKEAYEKNQLIIEYKEEMEWSSDSEEEFPNAPKSNMLLRFKSSFRGLDVKNSRIDKHSLEDNRSKEGGEGNSRKAAISRGDLSFERNSHEDADAIMEVDEEGHTDVTPIRTPTLSDEEDDELIIRDVKQPSRTFMHNFRSALKHKKQRILEEREYEDENENIYTQYIVTKVNKQLEPKFESSIKIKNETKGGPNVQMSGMASIQIKAGNTSHSAYNVVNKLPAENDYDLDNFTKSFFDTNEKITPTHILDQRKVAVVGNPMGGKRISNYKSKESLSCNSLSDLGSKIGESLIDEGVEAENDNNKYPMIQEEGEGWVGRNLVRSPFGGREFTTQATNSTITPPLYPHNGDDSAKPIKGHLSIGLKKHPFLFPTEQNVQEEDLFGLPQDPDDDKIRTTSQGSGDESSVNSEEEKERNKYKKVVLLRDAQPDMSSVEDVLGPKKVVEVSQPRLEAGICKNFKPTQVKTKYLPTEFPPSFFDMEELDDDNLHSQMQPNSPLNKLLSPSGTPVPHSPDSPRSAPLKRPKPQILAMKEDFRKLQEPNSARLSGKKASKNRTRINSNSGRFSRQVSIASEDLYELYEDEQYKEKCEKWQIERETEKFDYKAIHKNTLLEDQFKPKKITTWSGQEVMENYDEHRAVWLTERLNSIRFFDYGFCGFFDWTRYVVRCIVKSGWFEQFMTICVLTNTVTLAIDRYGIDDQEKQNLKICNYIFTGIFIVELVVKLYGLGLKRYCSDSMNYLDASVVLISLVELIFLGDGESGGLSAFRTIRIFRAVRIIRTFRVLRVARLLRTFEDMQWIIGVIGNSIGTFIYIALLLFLFLFIFALLGMEIFGGRIDFYEGVPRTSFDSFHWSFITMFQVLSLENWQTVLYDCMRAQNPILTSLFLISWIFLGNFVLLNLFLAILLDAFLIEEEEDEEETKLREEEEERKKQRKEKKAAENQKETATVVPLEGAASIKKSKNKKSTGSINMKKATKSAIIKKLSIGKSTTAEEDEEEYDIDADLQEFIDLELTKKAKIMEEEEGDIFKGIYCNYAYYVFSKDNPFRYWSARMVKSEKWKNKFETLILFLIILGSIKLAVDTYYVDSDDDSTEKQVSYWFDLSIGILFFFEYVMKSVAYGFILEDNSYLRDSWNRLDYFIVVASIVDFCVPSVELPVIKVLRMLRTLRPLRFISHNRALKVVVMTLINSVSGIINVAIVIIVVWLMFAILGVNLFGGKFQYCSIDMYEHHYKEDCNQIGGRWKTFDANFDNVISGMMSLFIISSLEGWPDIMYQATDATDIEQGPERDATPLHAYFFVAFVLIGSFFFLNLFIGVIFKKFTDANKEEKDKEFGTAEIQAVSFLDEKSDKQKLRERDFQEKWMEIIELMKDAQPKYETSYRPVGGFRLILYNLVTHNVFEVFIMACIFLNMLQMAMLYEDASSEYRFGLDIVNYIFTGVFIVEASLKLTAYGIAYYKNSWNNFDFCVVMASIVDIILLTQGDSMKALRVGPQLARVLRVLRVSRLFRLINKYETLAALINVIQVALPRMMNVFLLLLLVYFIYAILGCFSFHEIKSGDVIDDYTNFHNFGMAMIVLIRVSTGEDWNKIMFDCMRTEDDDCVEGETCGTNLAPLFFLSFVIICTFVMLNLFVLVILELFESLFVSKDGPMSIFKGQLLHFQEAWGECHTLLGGTRIHQNDLIDLFILLPFPLGFNEDKNINNIRRASNKNLENQSDDEEEVHAGTMNKAGTSIEEVRPMRTITRGLSGVNNKGATNAKINRMHVYRRIVQLELTRDDGGYVYFNELLFQIIRFYQHSMAADVLHYNLNIKPIKKAEAEVYKSIMKKAKKHAISHKYTKKRAELVDELRTGNSNPFLTMMFMKLTLKQLKKYAYIKKTKVAEVEQIRKHDGKVQNKDKDRTGRRGTQHLERDQKKYVRRLSEMPSISPKRRFERSNSMRGSSGGSGSGNRTPELGILGDSKQGNNDIIIEDQSEESSSQSPSQESENSDFHPPERRGKLGGRNFISKRSGFQVHKGTDELC